MKHIKRISPGHRVAVIAESAHGSGTSQAGVHLTKPHLWSISICFHLFPFDQASSLFYKHLFSFVMEFEPTDSYVAGFFWMFFVCLPVCLESVYFQLLWRKSRLLCCGIFVVVVSIMRLGIGEFGPWQFFVHFLFFWGILDKTISLCLFVWRIRVRTISVCHFLVFTIFVCLFERLVARQKSLPSSCSSQY